MKLKFEINTENKKELIEAKNLIASLLGESEPTTKKTAKKAPKKVVVGQPQPQPQPQTPTPTPEPAQEHVAPTQVPVAPTQVPVAPTQVPVAPTPAPTSITQNEEIQEGFDEGIIDTIFN